MSRSIEASRRKARRQLERMKPYQKWVAETDPSEEARAWYRRIRRELERTASHGQQREVSLHGQ